MPTTCVVASEPTLKSKTLGERVRAAYLAKGLNRAQVARALGVAYPTILSWESNERVPQTDNLNALAVLTGVSIGTLLDVEGDAVTEPQYKTWKAFMKTEAAATMTAGERSVLASMHFPDDDEPTVETYRGVLLAIRMGRRA